jgi:hypothetical protein
MHRSTVPSAPIAARNATQGVVPTCVGPDESGRSYPPPAGASLRRGQELPQADLYHGPRQQPVLLRYGDDHPLSRHAVLTPNQLVGEAPRPLVAEEDGAVLPRCPPRPRKQRRGACHRVQFVGFRHYLLPSIPVGMLQRLELACPLDVTHPRHRQPPGRAGLLGPDPRQVGAAGRAGGLPVRPRRPLASVRASSLSVMLAVCRRRPSTKDLSSSVR